MPERAEKRTRERRRAALEWIAVACEPHVSDMVACQLVGWLDDRANHDTFCGVFEVMWLIDKSETTGTEAELKAFERESDELMISAAEHKRYCEGLEWNYALEDSHLTKDAWSRFCAWQLDPLNQSAFDCVADVMELTEEMHWPGRVVLRVIGIE